MTLRDYQADAVATLRDAVKRERSAVYVLPTGGGKTVVAAEIARLGTEKGNRTLLLVHRRELVRQAVDTLKAAVPEVPVGVEAAGWTSWPGAALQVGMVQSIVRRKWDVHPDIVIVDEAHHARASTWEKVLARWPGAARIGLTATPERGDGRGLGEHFNRMVLGPTIPELVAGGWLAPVRTMTIPVGLDMSGLKPNRRGEFRPEDVDGRITRGVVARAGDAYVKYASGRRAIFFAATIRHSERVVADLKARGVRAAHVDGGDSWRVRDRIMDEFKRGQIDVVSNVALIDEGFDAPACDVVMIGAPTRSVTRFLQQSGRCMRPGEGKEALVLDLAGVVHDLGLPDEVRDWSLEDGEVKEGRGKKRGPSICPECMTAYYVSPCPGCGRRPPERITEVNTDLVEATAKRAAAAAARVSAGRKKALVDAIRAPNREVALMILEEFERAAGYRKGWAGYAMANFVAPTRRNMSRVS